MRARLRLASLTVLLLPLSLVGASPALADGPPAAVSIGNGPSTGDGSYVNAQLLADNMTSTSVVVEASASITVVDPIDLSASGFGLPIFNLTLKAPVCNILNPFAFGQFGRLFLTCGTVNFGATITSGTARMPATRVVSTATQVGVLSSAASIQQAIDDSSTSSPVTVTVGPGLYAEDLTIAHSVTLHGDDGSAPTGAGASAPSITGTQPGGSVITVTASNVTVDGVHLSGTVTSAPVTRSLHGISATAVDAITLAHNSFDGFSGSAIQTTGSTSITTTANAISPTLLSTQVSPSSPAIAAGTDQQLTDTGSDSEGGSADLTAAATWSTSDEGIATVDAAGLVHGVAPGTATITASVLGLDASTDVQVGAALSQTITFGSTPPASPAVGGSYLVSATASSGLPVSVSIDAGSTPGACAVAAAVVTFTGVGTCIVDADQPGDASYPAAARVSQSLTIAKGAQTITFTSTPPSQPTVGDVYPVTATASSGLPVTFSLGTNSTAGACSRSGQTVTLTGPGTCIVNASQAGNANYLAAPRVQQILLVTVAGQAPAFSRASPPTSAYAGAGYLYAFAASGSPAPTYGLAPGAPSWLSIDADSGVVTGTPPTGTTSFSYSVTATNAGGPASSGPFVVSVSALPRQSLRANLAVTLACPKKARVGVTVTCQATVTNHGPAPATNYRAVMVLPGSFQVLSVSAGGVTVDRDSVWGGASLASGASVTLTVTGRATAAGSQTASAAVWSDQADAKPLYNVRHRVWTFS